MWRVCLGCSCCTRTGQLFSFHPMPRTPFAYVAWPVLIICSTTIITTLYGCRVLWIYDASAVLVPTKLTWSTLRIWSKDRYHVLPDPDEQTDGRAIWSFLSQDRLKPANGRCEIYANKAADLHTRTTGGNYREVPRPCMQKIQEEIDGMLTTFSAYVGELPK